jgi:1-acyl-sn-glycerol-3-phosphate acyltransferase
MGGSQSPIPVWLAVAAGLWLVFAAVVHWVRAWSTRNDGARGDDFGTGAAILLFWLYARVVHRVRFEGLEHVPRGKTPPPEGLLIVANHTAGIDPLLVQAACRFEIRWMMAEDMRAPALDLFWRFARIIFVDRRMGDRRAASEALHHLRSGGALGVFPEARIERPPRVVLPFMPGVGVFAKRTHVPVLPVFIEGTPLTPTAWGSLWRPSRARVVFLPMVRYGKGSALGPREVAKDLRRRIAGVAGWPLEDNPPPLEWREGRYGK